MSSRSRKAASPPERLSRSHRCHRSVFSVSLPPRVPFCSLGRVWGAAGGGRWPSLPLCSPTARSPLRLWFPSDLPGRAGRGRRWLTGAFGFAKRLRDLGDARSQDAAQAGDAIMADVRRGEPRREGDPTHQVMVRVDDAARPP